MLVVDAGVVVAALVSDDDLGAVARQRLADPCAAPQLVDLEVGSAVRRLALGGRISARRGAAALRDLADLPLQRAPHRPLLARCWELRDAVSFYDAAYVALAEALACTLLTTDRPLTGAPGTRCPMELLSSQAF